jgi:Flp pilus assembly pilin Flp
MVIWQFYEYGGKEMKEIKRFLADESGPELVEWAVVTMILILATYLVLRAIGGTLNDIYQRILDTLNEIVTWTYD